MKLLRVLARLAVLLLAAAAFAKLTRIYGGLMQPPLPSPGYRATYWQRPSAPQVSHFLEFVGAALAVGLFCVGGRVVLRLRLSSGSNSEEQPVSLGLHRGYGKP